MLDNLHKVQENLRYFFDNLDLLKIALTHRSFASENNLDYNNERMEFLGDSVLSAVVSEYLYKKYYDDNEGKLSQIKAQIVSAKNLSVWAKKVKLNEYVLVSRSEEANFARQRESLLCDSFEAIIGAMYLDSDYSTARNFINRFLYEQKEIKSTDYKSHFQEMIQAQYQILPEYKVVKEYGPDHEKTFEIEVYVKGKSFGFGKGSSKKQAEQLAALSAIKKIQEDFIED